MGPTAWRRGEALLLATTVAVAFLVAPCLCMANPENAAGHCSGSSSLAFKARTSGCQCPCMTPRDPGVEPSKPLASSGMAAALPGFSPVFVPSRVLHALLAPGAPQDARPPGRAPFVLRV